MLFVHDLHFIHLGYNKTHPTIFKPRVTLVVSKFVAPVTILVWSDFYNSMIVGYIFVFYLPLCNF